MPFTFVPLEIPDVVRIEPRVFGDDRGWFMETYKRSDFEKHGIAAEFRQDNHSRSTQRGVLRGLHYQLDPSAQGKLVRCTEGEVWDVAVDIRQGSPTYGKWVAATLSAENKHQLWIPAGFAHAFLTLTPNAEVLYKTTREYDPTAERSIRWNDPALGIQWPIPSPILHPRDAAAPPLAEAHNNFRWNP